MSSNSATDKQSKVAASLNTVPSSVHKPVTQLLGTATISAFIGLLQIPVLLTSILRIGPSRFFSKKTRTDRPECLMDPNLGDHKMITLKVSESCNFMCSSVVRNYTTRQIFLVNAKEPVVVVVVVCTQCERKMG